MENPPANPSRRSVFALTGPSTALDPRRFAVRPDLADARLAGRVFAPHFAAPLPCRVAGTAEVSASRDGGEVIARLAAGDEFQLLDVAGGRGWGIATAAGVVGYVDERLLEVMR